MTDARTHRTGDEAGLPRRGGSVPAPTAPDHRSRLRQRILPDWSNRSLVAVWIARVSMSAGRALAAVVAPVYLARLGYSGLRLGEMFAVIAIAAAALSAAVGLLSDRIGRRPFLVVFPLLTAGAVVVFATSEPTWVLFAAASVGSFGRGAGAGAGAVGPYQPAESALVTELAPDRVRNVVFGRLAFGSSLGALIGGLLAVATDAGAGSRGAALVDAFRPAFLVMALVSLLAGVVALAITEPPRPARATHHADGTKRTRFPRRSLPLLVRLWVSNSVNGLAIGMFGPFVTYWFYRRYGAGPGEIGALFAVINVVTLASTLSAAGMAKRWGLVRTVSVVRVVQAVLLVPMVLAPSFLLAGAIYLVRMVVQRAGLPLRQSYVLAMADPEERSSVAALANIPSQVAMAASPIASGYLLEEVSLSLPFEIAGGLQLVNAVMFWVFFRHRPPAEEEVGTPQTVPANPRNETVPARLSGHGTTDEGTRSGPEARERSDGRPNSRPRP